MGQAVKYESDSQDGLLSDDGLTLKLCGAGRTDLAGGAFGLCFRTFVHQVTTKHIHQQLNL